MYCSGLDTFSTLTTPLRRMSVSESVADGGTIPGQSIRKMRRMRVMYCQTFVSPGMGATVQTFFLRNVLMTDDFPVLGYPMRPTETCFLSECRAEN